MFTSERGRYTYDYYYSTKLLIDRTVCGFTLTNIDSVGKQTRGWYPGIETPARGGATQAPRRGARAGGDVGSRLSREIHGFSTLLALFSFLSGAVFYC